MISDWRDFAAGVEILPIRAAVVGMDFHTYAALLNGLVAGETVVPALAHTGVVDDPAAGPDHGEQKAWFGKFVGWLHPEAIQGRFVDGDAEAGVCG